MFDCQKSFWRTRVALPMAQRYCCMKKLWGSSGHVPMASGRGTYLICVKGTMKGKCTVFTRNVMFFYASCTPAGWGEVVRPGRG